MKVEVPEYEIQENVEVDPAKTVLLIVDMQNDFVRKDGKLSVPTAEETIPAIKGLRDFARQHSIRVFYTQDSHYAGDPEFEIWGEHVVVGTRGWEIIEELAPDAEAGDRVFRKDRYDGFFRTTLEQTLTELDIDTIVICGTVANICVHYTAASAALRWYRVIFPIDATSALNEFDLQAAIRQTAFLLLGVITRTNAIRAEGQGNQHPKP